MAIQWLSDRRSNRPQVVVDYHNAVWNALESVEQMAWDDNSQAVQEILRGDQNVFGEIGALLDMPCAFAKLVRAKAIAARAW